MELPKLPGPLGRRKKLAQVACTILKQVYLHKLLFQGEIETGEGSVTNYQIVCNRFQQRKLLRFPTRLDLLTSLVPSWHRKQSSSFRMVPRSRICSILSVGKSCTNFMITLQAPCSFSHLCQRALQIVTQCKNSYKSLFSSPPQVL